MDSRASVHITIVEELSILTQALKAILQPSPALHIRFTYDSIEQLLKDSNKSPYDLILLDMDHCGDDPLCGVARLLSEGVAKRVVGFSTSLDEHDLFEALATGMQGYVCTAQTLAHLPYALEHVGAGGFFVSPELTRWVVSGYLSVRECMTPARIKLLTPREREVFEHIALGHSSISIAEELFISDKTVEKHRSNIMKKLGVHSAAELRLLHRQLPDCLTSSDRS